MRSEEEPIFTTNSVRVEGQVQYDGYKHSEIMVIELHHPKGLLFSRRGGWSFCLRCKKKFQPGKAKSNSRLIPIRGTYQIVNGNVILQIPRRKAKKGHCRTCGRVLNDKGEKSTSTEMKPDE
jgi:hypothetical protein